MLLVFSHSYEKCLKGLLSFGHLLLSISGFYSGFTCQLLAKTQKIGLLANKYGKANIVYFYMVFAAEEIIKVAKIFEYLIKSAWEVIVEYSKRKNLVLLLIKKRSSKGLIKKINFKKINELCFGQDSFNLNPDHIF